MVTNTAIQLYAHVQEAMPERGCTWDPTTAGWDER